MPYQQVCWRRSSNFQSLLANAASRLNFGLNTALYPIPEMALTWQVTRCYALVVTCCTSTCWAS